MPPPRPLCNLQVRYDFIQNSTCLNLYLRLIGRIYRLPLSGSWRFNHPQTRERIDTQRRRRRSFNNINYIIGPTLRLTSDSYQPRSAQSKVHNQKYRYFGSSESVGLACHIPARARALLKLFVGPISGMPGRHLDP